MRFRRFKAPGMREAMARVREEMGEDAVIVTTEQLPDGSVEVTAAAERPRPAPPPRVSEPTTLESRLEQRLRARLRAEAQATGTNTPPAASVCLADIEAVLAFHQVPDAARQTMLRAAEAHEATDAPAMLARALEGALAFQPIGDALPRSIMLVGTPGSGKTVTAAKLAARAVLSGQGVDFITADAIRSGALAQSKAYADVLNQDVCEVRGADELAMLLDTRAEIGRDRPCIIDTPAANLLDSSEVDLMARLVQAAAPAGVEPVAVIAAGADALDMAEAAILFARLGCRRAIVTRTDATRRLGPVITALADAGLAAAELGIKPYIAGGLAPATPVRLAELITARSTATPPAPTRLDAKRPMPVPRPGNGTAEEHEPA